MTQRTAQGTHQFSPSGKYMDDPIVPENLTTFAKYLVNQVLGVNAAGTVTEEALRENTKETLRVAIDNAKRKGRNYVTYEDYPDMYNGMSIKDFVSSGEARRDQYGDGKPAYAKIMLDTYDPSLAAATLIGGFNFTENEDGYTIQEPYDFGPIKEGGEGDAYRTIREYVGTNEEMQVPVQVKVFLEKQQRSNNGEQR